MMTIEKLQKSRQQLQVVLQIDIFKVHIFEHRFKQSFKHLDKQTNI